MRKNLRMTKKKPDNLYSISGIESFQVNKFIDRLVSLSIVEIRLNIPEHEFENDNKTRNWEKSRPARYKVLEASVPYLECKITYTL